MLMTGTNKTINLDLENKTLFNNTSNTKLYFDKKGVYYAKGRISKVKKEGRQG